MFTWLPTFPAHFQPAAIPVDGTRQPGTSPPKQRGKTAPWLRADLDLTPFCFPCTAQGFLCSLPGHLAGSGSISLLPGCSKPQAEGRDKAGVRPGHFLGCATSTSPVRVPDSFPAQALGSQMNAPIELPAIKHTSGLQSTTQMIFFGCLQPPVKVSLVFIFPAPAEGSSLAKLARKTGKARKFPPKMGVRALTDSPAHWVCSMHWDTAETWRLKRGINQAELTLPGPISHSSLKHSGRFINSTSSGWFCKLFQKEMIFRR